ncbi:MAG: nucleotide disphospho-sugar-binding domain-containing protein [Pseudomonadota bacterium]
MANVVYAWEMGDDLGHVSAFLPIANVLRVRGWPVTCITKQVDVAVERVRAAGFEWQRAPVARTVTADRLFHALIIRYESGLSSAPSALYLIRSWMSLLQSCQCELLVADFAPVARLAAYALGIPCVTVDPSAFFSIDFSDGTPGFAPTVSKEMIDQATALLLADVNTALRTIGVKPIDHINDINRGDRNYHLNHPELAPFDRYANGTYWGPVIAHERTDAAVSWPVVAADAGGLAPALASKKIFAYLKGNCPESENILSALRDLGVPALAYLSGFKNATLMTIGGPSLQLHLAPLPMANVLEQADLVICHAGIGMINQALHAKVPLLCMPMYLEQRINAENVTALGAGKSLHTTEQNTTTYRTVMEQMLTDPSYASAAASFAARRAPCNVDRLVDDLMHWLPATVSQRAPLRLSSAAKEVVAVNELDVIFLSYDEPNADENWQHLLTVAPWAKRVHGVKGFDAAHKQAALTAQTERFVTVDADNKVFPDFFEFRFEVPAKHRHAVWSWSSINAINGMHYGNGGLKIWTREIVNTMRSHEIARCDDPAMALDFFCQSGYKCFYPAFSTTHPCASPYQAFRAGFREAVKGLEEFGGSGVDPAEIDRQASAWHVRTLGLWMSVGSDLPNGPWAMLGARRATLMMLDKNFDSSIINDFEAFSQLWEGQFAAIASAEEQSLNPLGKAAALHEYGQLWERVVASGDQLRRLFSKPLVQDLSPERSLWMKASLKQQVKQAHPFAPFAYDC